MLRRYVIIQLFLVSILAAQSITVTVPDGGEIWRNNTVQRIEWISTGSISKVNIEYYNGSSWINVPGAQNISNTGAYDWQIPNVSTSKAKVRISNASNINTNDISNNNFRLIVPNIYSNPVKIMPLGNSITWDARRTESRSDGQKISYRYVLWDSLRSNNISFDLVGTQSSGYDFFPDFENEGHPGWRDDQIAVNIYGWLQANPNTDIILLHIGTNDLDSSRADVQNILNQIDIFEANFSKPIWVILARIINRVPYSSLTTTFNNNIQAMAVGRINNGDRLLLVDMENDAGLNYSISTTPPYSGGDMYDDLHPNASGYKKMAGLWWNALKLLLPGPAPAPPIITSSPILNAITGQVYTYDVDASGVGAPDYYLNIKPSNMIINKHTGKINWTPGLAGSFGVRVEARNSSGSYFQNYTINVGDAVCPPGLVNYWKLDETDGGTYSDQTGSSNAFAGTNGPIPVSGRVAGAQQFNGSNTQINVPASSSFNFPQGSAFSLIFWMKSNLVASSSKPMIGRFSSTDGFRWFIGILNGKSYVYMSSSGSSSSVTGSGIIADGTWHHIAVTRSTSGTVKLYVDGTQQGQSTFNKPFVSSTSALNIGWYSFQNNFFAGSLDEIAIFNNELTPSVISQHYNNGLSNTGYCSGSSQQSAPVITSSPVTSAVVGSVYSYDVNANGNPAPTYTLTTSPSDMTINSSTGLIQWTPSAAGNYNVSVTAGNGISPNAVQSFTINVGTTSACPPGMISYWKFDESSGSVFNDAMGVNTARAGTSAPAVIPGRVGNARFFNGTSTQINVPANGTFDFAINTPFTVELWTKTTYVSTLSKPMIGRFSSTEGFRWFVGLINGKTYLYMSSSGNSVSAAGTISIADGGWHHIVITRTPQGLVTMYVDGVQEATRTFNKSFISSTAPLNIGWYNFQTNYFTGGLDEIAIYNTAFTITQVQHHYTNGLNGINYCGTSSLPKGTVTSESEIPTQFRLLQNYPNPFNPETNIKFELPSDQHVKIVIYDMLGREVSRITDEFFGAGIHKIKYKADGLSAGIYVYVMEAGGFKDMKKLIYLK